jgi:hypothetical protein
VILLTADEAPDSASFARRSSQCRAHTHCAPIRSLASDRSFRKTLASISSSPAKRRTTNTDMPANSKPSHFRLSHRGASYRGEKATLECRVSASCGAKRAGKEAFDLDFHSPKVLPYVVLDRSPRGCSKLQAAGRPRAAVSCMHTHVLRTPSCTQYPRAFRAAMLVHACDRDCP